MSQSKATPRLVGIREAGQLTGLDNGTLYKLARQGRVRSYRVLGRSIRFDRSDLEALIRIRPTPGAHRAEAE